MGRRNGTSRAIVRGLLLASLLCSCGLPQRDEVNSRGPGSPVFIESHNFVSQKAGKSRLDVNVRVPLSFFVFVRTRPEAVPPGFTGRTDLAVEILDTSHRSVARTILRREIPSTEERPSSAPDRFLEEMFSFDLPPGEYSVVTEVNDLESSRRFMDTPRKIALKDFSKGLLDVSNLVFLIPSAANDSGSVAPIGFGGDVPFGRSAYGYVELVSSAPAESIRASYAIHAAPSDGESHPAGSRDSLRPVVVSRDRFLEPVKNDEGFSYRVSRGPRSGQYALWLSENGDTLPQGSYELEARISDGASATTLRHPFRISWIDMPRSLRNFPVALEALRYIASDSEMHEISSASPGRRKVLFDLFWKPRDPTPETAFNERMAEYFKRVDYAMDNFGSFREANGMRTDRGKAYILYGPPASIDRDLRPGSDPVETWNYPGPGKQLIFVDRTHHGEYILYETKTLR